MKTAATILRVVGIVYLVLGIIIGIFLIGNINLATGFSVIAGSVIGAFLLITFAELAINIAAIRNAIGLYVESKIPEKFRSSLKTRGQYSSREEWECSECGTTVSAAAKICPKCGADLSEIEN